MDARAGLCGNYYTEAKDYRQSEWLLDRGKQTEQSTASSSHRQNPSYSIGPTPV